MIQGSMSPGNSLGVLVDWYVMLIRVDSIVLAYSPALPIMTRMIHLVGTSFQMFQ